VNACLTFVRSGPDNSGQTCEGISCMFNEISLMAFPVVVISVSYG
jgi:hypothetical protein